MSDRPLREIAWLVARNVNGTLGGGYASTELLRRTFIGRGWLDASAHALLTAVSRLTPGTNILAYCLMLGWRLRGRTGGLVALAAASVPSAAIVLVVSAALVRVDQYAAVRAALAIGMFVAAGLVLASAWALLRPYLTRPHLPTTVLLSALASALFLLDVTPVRILLVAAAAGFALPPHADARKP